ncbi:MAG: hypothetical protein ACE5IL_13440 [Myxococcota bacterium]
MLRKRLNIAILFCFLGIVGIGRGGLAGAPEPARSPVEYFTIWSYTRNVPSEPLEPSELENRTLGYWELHLDSGGAVESAAFHASDGALWLSIRYVEEGGHVYADVYSAAGALVVRKSTQLHDRLPRPGP